MKVAVTGATGFIGGAIAREAKARGHEVTAPYRGTAAPSEAIAASAANAASARWVRWDEWERGEERFDLVIHAAALRHRHGVAASDYERVNGELTDRVIARAKRAKTSRLLLVSSISAYGWPARPPIDETFPAAPIGPYGRSKVATEQRVERAGLPFTIVQPSITYGPGDTNGMIDKMTRMIAKGAFVVPGRGRTRVQLVYIDDLARIVLDAAVSARTLGERFICTYKDPIHVGDLVQEIARAVHRFVFPVGPPTSFLHLAATAMESLERVGVFGGKEPPLTREKLATISVDRAYDIGKMRGLLGTEPQVGYEDGLARTARAMNLA